MLESINSQLLEIFKTKQADRQRIFDSEPLALFKKLKHDKDVAIRPALRQLLARQAAYSTNVMNLVKAFTTDYTAYERKIVFTERIHDGYVKSYKLALRAYSKLHAQISRAKYLLLEKQDGILTPQTLLDFTDILKLNRAAAASLGQFSSFVLSLHQAAETHTEESNPLTELSLISPEQLDSCPAASLQRPLG